MNNIFTINSVVLLFTKDLNTYDNLYTLIHVQYNCIVIAPKDPAKLTPSATTDVLKVTWEAPPTGQVGTYRITMTTMAGVQVMSTDVTSTNATVTGLTAGTGYNVIVVAVSGDQRSKALHESVYTSKFADEYFRGDDYIVPKLSLGYRGSMRWQHF